jgi:hypothetical protein
VTEPEHDPNTDPAAPTPLRLLSLVAVVVLFLLYRPGAEPSLLDSAILPLIALLAAWYLTHSMVVVALGTFLLALAHADLASGTWLDGRIYPAIAALSGVVLAAVLARRFRIAMAARRGARRAARDAREASTRND